jgi:hypothetical protein
MKKQSYKERREIDEMIKFEIESGNPFSAFTSYKSYKATGRKKVIKTEEKPVEENIIPKTENLEEDSLPF